MLLAHAEISRINYLNNSPIKNVFKRKDNEAAPIPFLVQFKNFIKSRNVMIP